MLNRVLGDTLISKSLQVPNGDQDMIADDGSDVESDDLKYALGKKRRGGDQAPIQLLTKMQRIYMIRLISKNSEDIHAMSRDLTLNKCNTHRHH